MTPDLRAIESALLGEPYDPTNLSPEVASVVLPLVRRVVRERDELREALEEARLTLAAEQGRVEGAPSEGWQIGAGEVRWGKVAGGDENTYGIGMLVEQVWDAFVLRGWRWTCRQLHDRGSTLIVEDIASTARAAMLAADKALFESRRTRCLAKARQLQSDSVILYPPNGTHQQTPAIMIDRLSDPDLTEAVLAIYEAMLFNHKEVKS